MSENQLVTIVEQSGLETTKAQIILAQFQGYFNMASEWEAKAKRIVVTTADQVADMAEARAGRLYLREKRLAVERTRKDLKEQALREGKAIDGLANVLKALIVPIEEYLDQQEHFVENRAAAQAEAERVAKEKAEEAERAAKEKAEAAERVRITIENERLRREAFERDAAERAQRESEAAARRKLEEAAATARRAAERVEREAREKAARERAEADRRIKDEQEKAARERRELEARVALEKEKAARAQARRVEEERKHKVALGKEVACPKCGEKFRLADV